MNIESIVKHLFRLGEVTAIYDDKGYVQVTFFDRDEEARDLPMFSFINEYDMPNLKDTVLCFFLPFFKDGLCLGRFWSDSHTPPTDIKRTVWYKKLRSKGAISFDDETETLTINAKHINIVADDVSNSGSLNCAKKINSDVDVTSNSISLIGHLHGNGNQGSDTTAPK